jgi:hypothetical protein
MELFLHFQKVHPKLIVGKRSFDSLHPFWVKTMKEKNIYCCIYHTEMEELKVGFNYMQKNSSLHSNTKCSYSCEEVRQPIDGFNQGCISSHGTFSGLTTM